ncbi:hypothetical protein [Chromobacterium haemolyticum]|uniref:hypothetical protein n=1 Tax=Chromobacterium haemolyticum TaxID=394935 RepID=UPI0012FCAB19|nr:hypothetical protein [Chromobacterium haemolyticum]
MIIQVVARATGGWLFHFGITESQAYQIINTKAGSIVSLNGPNEQIKRSDSETFCHFVRLHDGSTTEDLVASDVIEKINDLINSRAWDANEG